MQEVTTETVAKSLYEAYGLSADWKNYQGLPMPSWDQLTEAIRGHWTASAREALRLHTAGYLKLVRR